MGPPGARVVRGLSPSMGLPATERTRAPGRSPHTGQKLRGGRSCGRAGAATQTWYRIGQRKLHKCKVGCTVWDAERNLVHLILNATAIFASPLTSTNTDK